MTPDGLRALGQRCDTLAGQFASPVAVTVARTWQSSATAVNIVTASIGKAGKKLADHMHATGSKFNGAASHYEAADGGAGAAIGVAGATIPGSSAGVDGGAGALPSTPR